MISFKNAKSSDLDGLVNVHNPQTQEKSDQIRKLQEKRINQSLEPENKFIIALYGDMIVGHVVVEGNKMKALFVEESKRNQGLGTEIMKEVEKRLKSHGFDEVELSVNPDENKKAKKLYERLGYKVKNNEKHLEYVDPVDGAEDWVIDLIKNI